MRSTTCCRRAAALLGSVVLGALVLVPFAPAASAAGGTTYVVDNTDATCSDIGGAANFCTIGAAARKALQPGDTVLVRPGTYREEVRPFASGTADAPVSFRAAGAGVLLLGTRNVSDPAGWTAVAPTDGGTFSRPYAPPSSPSQVFVDGKRLARAGSATGVTANTFFFDAVAKVLYVNVGGGNPGNGHTVEAGATTQGFTTSGFSNILVEGFAARWQNNYGFRVSGGTGITVRGGTVSETGVNGIRVENITAGGVTVESNQVSGSASIGIRLSDSTGVTLRANSTHDNALAGLALAGASGNLVEGNTSFANSVAPGGTGAAAGIDVNSSATSASNDNVVVGNVTYGNQDSGLQVYSGSTRNVLSRNVSYRNGDHGFDANNSPANRYLGNTSYGNVHEGLNFEGASSGATLVDNIAVDNGLSSPSGHYDLFVDTSSANGFTADRDILFNSNGQPVTRVGGTTYGTVALLTAGRGLEPNGLTSDPMFVTPNAADLAAVDLHLRPSSPGQDRADTSAAGLRLTDATGQAPADDPVMPDRGAGPVPFADLGAYETLPDAGVTNYPPRAALTVDPPEGSLPPTFVAVGHAEASADFDAHPIVSYTFDFGDGVVVGPQADPTASHGFTATGTYAVKLTVTDAAGATDVATRNVPVRQRALRDLVVDGADPQCSDTGGAAPFCHIAAAAGLALAGDTVSIRPATYREEIVPRNSGETGNPITYRATGPGVVIDGTDDLSANTWSAAGGGVYTTAFAPRSPPRQVFADGRRLTVAASPSGLTSGSFAYDVATATLSVHLGGDAPTAHRLEAGARTYGWKLWDLHDLVVDGLTVRRANSVGIDLLHGSAVTLRNVGTEEAGAYGIDADTSTGLLLDAVSASGNASVGVHLNHTSGSTVRSSVSHDNGFHGFGSQDSSGNTFEAVTAYGNVSTTASANGMDLNVGSANNVVRRSRFHDNQDSGLQVYNGSHDNVLVRNLSWHNGDHGIDVKGATGTRVLSNTLYENRKDGVSVEGGSTDTTFVDNISVHNGEQTAEFDLWVDGASVSGFVSDHNLVFSSPGVTPIKYNDVLYASLADYVAAASGRDVHSIEADPRFVSPASGDFRLTASSPAQDTADTTIAGFEAADIDGAAPVDNPAIPDTGVGSPAFVDIGAFENTTPAPAVVLVLTPTTAVTNQDVRADASATAAGAATIASYRFDCGNGSVTAAAPTASTTCRYAAPGTFTITVTVTDSAGQTSSASRSVSVAADAPPTAVLRATPNTGTAPLTVFLDGSGSTDSDATGIKSYGFSCGNGSATTVSSATTASCTYPTAGNYTATLTVTDTAGLSGRATALITVQPDPPPVVVVKTSTNKLSLAVAIDASASTDNTRIVSYTFNCGNGKVIGPQTAATTTCTYGSAGKYTVAVTARDTVNNSTTSTDSVQVKK